jgi:chromosome segregation ATPase
MSDHRTLLAMDARELAAMHARLEIMSHQMETLRENSKSFEDLCRELASQQRKNGDLVEKLGKAAEQHRRLNEELLSTKLSSEKRTHELIRKINDLRKENRELHGIVSGLESELETVRDELQERVDDAQNLREQMSKQRKDFDDKLRVQQEKHTEQINEIHRLIAGKSANDEADIDLREIAAEMHSLVFRELEKTDGIDWTQHQKIMEAGMPQEKRDRKADMARAAQRLGFSPPQWTSLWAFKKTMNATYHPDVWTIDVQRATARARSLGAHTGDAFRIACNCLQLK